MYINTELLGSDVHQQISRQLERRPTDLPSVDKASIEEVHGSGFSGGSRLMIAD